MSVDPVALLAPLEAFERAIRTVRAELDQLGAQRPREVAALADAWQGGHRARFDDALGVLDARARRIVDDLGAVLVLLRRGADDLATAPPGPGAATPGGAS